MEGIDADCCGQRRLRTGESLDRLWVRARGWNIAFNTTSHMEAEFLFVDGFYLVIVLDSVFIHIFSW